jgi:hypothetical protein
VSVEPAGLPIAGVIRNEQAHLLMGLEGAETRPGDPTSYKLQWLRDGAYTVVAMARAGRVDVARDLVTSFAENDFFGGFGAEGDAPGESLWAMYEVAQAADDPALYNSLWPHVRRKADLILTLLNTHQQVRRPYVGPLTVKDLDNDLVAYPAKDGLISGRMDWHQPTLFINAFAWRGLQDAAKFADRQKAPDEARRWRAAADQIKTAWLKKFAAEGLENPRTTASLLWPTRIAATDLAEVKKRLDTTPTGFTEQPLWTYFDVAHAHQFMAVGEPGKAWEAGQPDRLFAHAALGPVMGGRRGAPAGLEQLSRLEARPDHHAALLGLGRDDAVRRGGPGLCRRRRPKANPGDRGRHQAGLAETADVGRGRRFARRPGRLALGRSGGDGDDEGSASARQAGTRLPGRRADRPPGPQVSASAGDRRRRNAVWLLQPTRSDVRHPALAGTGGLAAC